MTHLKPNDMIDKYIEEFADKVANEDDLITQGSWLKQTLLKVQEQAEKKGRESERVNIQDQLNEIIAPHSFSLEEATLLTRAFNKVFNNNKATYGTFKEPRQ